MPTRRRFLQSSTLAAATLAAPRLFAAQVQDKSGLAPPILGEGDHQYECLHDWGQLPPTIAYGNTHGVCEDSQGNIYIKHTVHATSSKNDAIVVFDSDGKFIRSWGAEYKGGAHGLHLSSEKNGEYLYLCDQARGIVDKTTLTGEKVWTKTCPVESGLYNSAKEYHPTNVAMVPTPPLGIEAQPLEHAGEFFIADGYGKSWIHHYSANGEYLRSFGGPGAERGQVSCPHGLMIDTRHAIAGHEGRPLLLIADRANRRLQYFTLDGRHLAFFKDDVRLPCHFHTRGDMLLIPDLEARVTLLDRNNKLITQLGDGRNSALRDKPREQFQPGKFIAPHSAIFDHEGNIFVVEWVEVGRVTKLRKV
jgi:hypothetical protein